MVPSMHSDSEWFLVCIGIQMVPSKHRDSELFLVCIGIQSGS